MILKRLSKCQEVYLLVSVRIAVINRRRTTAQKPKFNCSLSCSNNQTVLAFRTFTKRLCTNYYKYRNRQQNNQFNSIDINGSCIQTFVHVVYIIQGEGCGKQVEFPRYPGKETLPKSMRLQFIRSSHSKTVQNAVLYSFEVQYPIVYEVISLPFRRETSSQDVRRKLPC